MLSKPFKRLFPFGGKAAGIWEGGADPINGSTLHRSQLLLAKKDIKIATLTHMPKGAMTNQKRGIASPF
jgi:hypothetical protein